MFLNFFKFKLPAASGPCPNSSFSILLCKEYVKDFFQILDAGRESSPAAMCSSFIVRRQSVTSPGRDSVGAVLGRRPATR